MNEFPNHEEDPDTAEDGMEDSRLEDDIEYVSRGELKREMQALQDLGRELSGVSGKVLDTWGLRGQTLEALKEAKRLVPRALSRHLRYVAKLLQEEDVDKLRERLDSLHRPHQLSVAAFHRAENWRDRLVDGDDSAVSEIIERIPNVDVQRLRQLTRNARKEAAANKTPKSARELFKLIGQAQQDGSQS